MIFLIGYEGGKPTYSFKLKSEEMATKYINTFNQMDIKLERVTAEKMAEFEREQERKLWG